MATIETRTIVTIGDDGKKREKPSYRVKIRLKGHPPETATFDRKTDANNWAQTTEAEMRARRYFGQSKRHTLSELIDRYQESALPNLKSAKSVKRRLEWWRNEAGYRMLSDLTPDVIAAARDKLKRTPKQKGGGERTGADINRSIAALSSACTHAVKELGWIEKNPCERVTKLKESKGRTRYLSEEELTRLLSACRKSKNPHIYLAVILSLTTGGRLSEVLGLCWQQIDFKNRVAIWGDTKNTYAKSLPLIGEAFTLLLARSKIRSLNDDRIFPPAKGSTKTPFVNLRKTWERVLSESNIEDFHWHDLRHTAASYLVMSGVSLAEVAKILGHRSLAMTLRYSHLSHKHVVSLGEKLAKELAL